MPLCADSAFDFLPSCTNLQERRKLPTWTGFVLSRKTLKQSCVTDSMSTGAIPLSLRYWYGASVPDFVAADSATVPGELTKNCNFNLQPAQRDAWLIQTEILRAQQSAE
jgi:hypothetical protein